MREADNSVRGSV